MPIQSALALVGVGKQASKGSAVSNPTFSHGVTDGAVIAVDIAQDRDAHTSGSLIATDVNRTAVMPSFGYSMKAHSKSIGAYLLGALGSVSTSGTTTFTHVFSPASTLPYYSTFGQFGGNNYKISDARVNTLAFNFDETGIVSAQVEGMGTGITVSGVTYTPTTDDSVASYFNSVSGYYKFSANSGTAATAKIKSGSITINNNLDAVSLAGSVLPDDVFNAKREIEVSLDLIPDDLTDWRAILTGTTSGTTVSATPIYGSFDIQFTNGTDTLTLASTRVAFTADFPSADAGGGVVTVSLAGLVLKPSGSNEITATLVNTQASY